MIDPYKDWVKETPANVPAGGGRYLCRSVEEAIVPPRLVRAAVKAAKTKQEHDEFWHFEVMARFGNMVLRVKPVAASYFSYSAATRVSDMKVLTRDLSNLVIQSKHYGYINVGGWPRLLFAWQRGPYVFIRVVPTKEDWFKGKVTPEWMQLLNWSKDQLTAAQDAAILERMEAEDEETATTPAA